MEVMGRTDSSGLFVLDGVAETEELLYVHAVARGYATVHLVRPSRPSAGPDPRLYTLTMRRAGSLRVTAMADTKTPIESHRFTALLLGADGKGLRDASQAPAGAQLYQVRITGDDGTALLDDLEPGYWAVSADEWRNFAAAEEVVVRVKEAEAAAVEIHPPSIDPSTFTRCVVSSLVGERTSALGTIDRFRVDDASGRPVAFWIQRGGEFFVIGPPGEEVRLKLIDQDANRESKQFEIRIGEPDRRVDPVW
jgi:hypothetical protein